MKDTKHMNETLKKIVTDDMISVAFKLSYKHNEKNSKPLPDVLFYAESVEQATELLQRHYPDVVLTKIDYRPERYHLRDTDTWDYTCQKSGDVYHYTWKRLR